MAMDDLTAAQLRALVDYSPETGVFRRIAGRYAGQIAGGNTRFGYRALHVNGYSYKAHRLAYLYVFGRWPSGEIDHINGDRCDNRLANLRDVTRAGNAQNLRAAISSKRSGLPLGVFYSSHKNGGRPFISRIWADGKRTHLGGFETATAAHEAYLAAKRKMHATCEI
jgi:hypothetical protein